MPDAGYFGLTYELLFEGDSAWTDITALVDSRTTKIDVAGCSEDLKSVISKCTFEMRYNSTPSKTVHSELVGKILSAKQAGQTVKFRMGGIASFVGKVDLGSFSQRNGRIPGFLTVTVEDNSYLLDEVMASSFEYPATNDLDDEGWAVFDKANLAESIVMLRFLDAGYTVDQIDLTTSDSITEKVRRVVYDADDERTYREMLDTLLFEHCAVIYTTPEGKLSVRRLYRESPVSERSVEEFLVGDGIETGGGDYSYDGVKVVWSNLSKLDGAVVYNANITMKLDDEGNREGEEIQPHHYWPEDGDIEETWQEFNATFLDREYQTKVSRTKNKDLSLISVKNAYYEVDKDAEILLANNPPEIEPTKARVLWWNSHSTDVKKLYGFTVVGDALFRSRLNESTYPTDARKLAEPYETEFVYTSEAAAKLANHLHRFYKYGDIHHRWSEIGVDTPMFQVVTVSAPDTLISSLGMVISQSISFPAPNKIKRSNSAIGITAFNSEPVKTRSIQLGGAPVNTGPAGSNGTRSVVQFILGTADGPYTDAGNVVGTDSAILGTDLALVGVEGAQWEYEAPTPDAGEIVWRREGYYTPPETWPKVWNTTPMTGASSFGITLHPSALTIPVSSRGVPYGGNITISAVFQNIPATYEITWGITGASFVDAGTNQTKVVDVSTITADAVIVTVSVLFGGVTYTDMATLNKVWDGLPAPHNFGGVTTVPTPESFGEPMMEGDYFLWAGATDATYTKGEIYEWDGDSWELSTNGNLVMTMFDDFADLANDVDSAVIGNAVIKKLVTIDAFIKNLKAQNLNIQSTGGLEETFLTFDGDNDYVDLGDVAISSSMSLSMWINPDDTTDGQCFFGKNTSSGGNIFLFGYWDGGYSVDFGGATELATGQKISGHLAHIVLTVEDLGDGSSVLTLYRDGILLDTKTSTNTITDTTGTTQLGMEYDSSTKTDYLKGVIKNVALYNRVITEEEVATLYNGGEVSTGLTNSWAINESTGSTIYDSVGSNDGTIYGASWETYIPKGFSIRAVSSENGDGVFEILSKAKRLFRVDGLSGKIFFGNNFWYDPSDGAIHTPNDKTVIRADGTIEAVDGRFTGNIIANSGLFKGIFDTTALRLEPGGANVLSKYVGDNYNQALDLYDYFVTSQGLSEDTYYRINSPTSGTYTFSSEYPPLDFSKVKYVSFIRSNVYRHVVFYDSTFTSLGRVRKRTDGTSYAQIKLNASITLAVAYGGDKLIVSSDIPINTDGLDDYQVYLSGDTLKVKLP